VAPSVVVQGETVPWPAGRLGMPLRIVGPEPWSLGIRLQHEAKGAHRLDVDPAPPGCHLS